MGQNTVCPVPHGTGHSLLSVPPKLLIAGGRPQLPRAWKWLPRSRPQASFSLNVSWENVLLLIVSSSPKRYEIWVSVEASPLKPCTNKNTTKLRTRPADSGIFPVLPLCVLVEASLLSTEDRPLGPRWSPLYNPTVERVPLLVSIQLETQETKVLKGTSFSQVRGFLNGPHPQAKATDDRARSWVCGTVGATLPGGPAKGRPALFSLEKVHPLILFSSRWATLFGSRKVENHFLLPLQAALVSAATDLHPLLSHSR